MSIQTATHAPIRETIAEVISDELDRQAHQGANRIDVPALAEAIEDAISDENHEPAGKGEPPQEGKRPDDLNSTNDD
jgi:hypothetical protein